MNQPNRSPPLPLGWRLTAHLTTLASLALFASVLAYWGWRWLGPTAVSLPAARNGDPVQAIVAAHLFGSVAEPSAAAPPMEPAPEVLAGDTRLVGVLAEPGGGGYAVFRFASGAAKVIATGEAIGAEAKLVSVRPDGIIVRDASGERVIALRAPPTPRAASAAAIATAGVGATARTAGCSAPAGFRGPIVRVNAELVQGLIGQPESWRALVEPRDGALVVREDGGFVAMLGLQRGDRVEQANGIALRTPEDVIGAVLRPLVASQSVRIAGTRGGERRELILQNAGACS